MFAPYEPDPAERLPRAAAEIAPGAPGDLEALVALAVAHRGADPVARRKAYGRSLAAAAAGGPGAPVVQVARVEGVAVEDGVAARIDSPEGHYVPAGGHPAGSCPTRPGVAGPSPPPSPTRASTASRTGRTRCGP